MYREPTEIEAAFLRLVTRGHAELEQQVASCRIADYDVTGWCDVQVPCGPASPIRYHADGPAIKSGALGRESLYVETILCVNVSGLLESVEIVLYGGEIDTPYSAFIEAAESGKLRYPSSDS